MPSLSLGFTASLDEVDFALLCALLLADYHFAFNQALNMAACGKQIPGQTQHLRAREVQSTIEVAEKKMPERTTLRRSSRLTEKARSTPVVFLENGLVSMEKTPDHLIQMYVISISSVSRFCEWLLTSQ